MAEKSFSPIHRYVAAAIKELAPREGARCLDYGCGAGEIVEIAAEGGLNIIGCDVFYAGGSYRSAADSAGLLGTRIFEMIDAKAPFQDRDFDAVCSNQVLEHVPDLAVTISDIVRVAKPGAPILLLFPAREVWREGHVGIPFLHWFEKSSQWRGMYALGLRSLGFGYFKAGKTRRQWASDACEWVDKYTFYRSVEEITTCLAREGLSVERREADYLRYRASGLTGMKGMFVRPVVRVLPDWLAVWVVRKLSGWVIVCRRPAG